jgi:hypothetical protein
MKFRSGVGCAMLLLGACVFAIRLQHAGAYALPQKGNLLAGVLALLLGALLVRPWFGENGPATWLARLALVATPVVLFFALYAVMAELEEVVILRAPDAQGEIQDLRLWIVDHDGAAWVTMPGSKADAHGLTDTRVELVRGGIATCVVATRSERREAVDRTHHLRHEKYAVQRFATSLGIFGADAAADTVTLRLTPCPDAS